LLFGDTAIEKEDAEAEIDQAMRQLKGLMDVSKDWKKRENRILGCVILSPRKGLPV